jgi:hypothetical protein
VNDYNVQVTVTNNTLKLGFVVKSTGNWVAVDNFRLSYISDGSPYFVLTPDVLNFTPGTTMKVLNVKGGNLTNDVTITSTPNFTLSRSSVTAAEAMAADGINVEVTSSASSAIIGDSLILTSGTARGKVTLNADETAIGVSNYALFFDQSTALARDITISGDMFNNIDLSAPAGISLSETSISKADALAGKLITVTWNKSVRVSDKYIHLNSGAKKDSVLVFAVFDNMISDWDGDTAVVVSKLSDFGWSQTDASGVETATVFNSYATTGVRYVAATNAAHTYKGKPLLGERVAYLRTWNSPASYVYNLEIGTLEAGKSYVFRGTSAWHNNETNPTFTYAVNSAKSNLGDTLGIQSKLCTVRQQAEDYGFTFVAKNTGIHYLTVSSNTPNDAMCAPEYLAVYPIVPVSTGMSLNSDDQIKVYPVINHGQVYVNLADKTADIRVFNLAGSMVQIDRNATGNHLLTLGQSGVYLINISSPAINKTVKVVKVD